MLDIDELAKMMNDTLAATDKDGKPIATTEEMKTYAKAVITSLQAALVNHAPGTVTATGAPGAPIPDGAAMGGLITALLAPTWAGINAGGFPGAPAVAQEAALSTAYLMGASLVNFDPGTITGTCTATPVSPGILAAGAGMGGKIIAIDGSAWSAALAAITMGGPLAEPVYTTIANYIKDKAEVAYASGAVTGTFAVGGGPMAAGAGVGGTIA